MNKQALCCVPSTQLHACLPLLTTGALVSRSTLCTSGAAYVLVAAEAPRWYGGGAAAGRPRAGTTAIAAQPAAVVRAHNDHATSTRGGQAGAGRQDAAAQVRMVTSAMQRPQWHLVRAQRQTQTHKLKHTSTGSQAQAQAQGGAAEDDLLPPPAAGLLPAGAGKRSGSSKQRPEGHSDRRRGAHRCAAVRPHRQRRRRRRQPRLHLQRRVRLTANWCRTGFQQRSPCLLLGCCLHCARCTAPLPCATDPSSLRALPLLSDLEFDSQVDTGKPWLINIYSHYVRRAPDAARRPPGAAPQTKAGDCFVGRCGAPRVQPSPPARQGRTARCAAPALRFPVTQGLESTSEGPPSSPARQRTSLASPCCPALPCSALSLKSWRARSRGWRKRCTPT